MRTGLELSLEEVGGGTRSLDSLIGQRGAVLVFVGNGCPTARSYEARLASLSQKAAAGGIALVAINSNNASLSPQDTLQEMTRRARAQGLPYPYVKDAGGELARTFGAVCTPHAFVVDRDLNVFYEGRIDDSRLGDRITSRDLENAVEDVLAGREVSVRHTDPFGCSIVW